MPEIVWTGAVGGNAGRQLLTRDFWKTADELVKAQGALLAGYERVQTVKQEKERRSREAELLVGAFVMTGGFRQEDAEPLHLPGPSPLPSSDAVVTAGQEAWRAVRSHLIRHRTQLAKQVVKLYVPAWRLAYAGLGAAELAALPSRAARGGDAGVDGCATASDYHRP